MATGIPVEVELVDLDYLNEVARCHWRKTTDKDIVNTSAETDLLNAEITIDAGAMETRRKLRVVIAGDVLQNGGADTNNALRIKLGGTTVYAVTTLPIAASANRRAVRIEFEICNLGAAGSQFLTGTVRIGDAAAGGPGLGALGGDYYNGTIASVYGSVSVDTSVAVALAVTWQWGSATSTRSFRCHYATVEVV